MSDQQETQAVETNGTQSVPPAVNVLKQVPTAAGKLMKQARARVVEYRGRRRPVKAVDFGLGELVKPLTSLKISVMGEYLSLPGAVAAVITQPNGRQIVHRVGGLLNYPPGHYGLQLVDVRQQRLHLQNVRATTADALQVTLTVDIIWQVDDVIPVVNMEQPHATWRSACKAAVLKIIQSNSHDNLAPVQGSTPISEEEIQNAIRDEISATPGLSAFKIIEVKVLNRQGDPERLGKIREASVAVTQREQELMAQIEQLKERLQEQQLPPAGQAGLSSPAKAGPAAGSSEGPGEAASALPPVTQARTDEVLEPARRLAQELRQVSQTKPLTRRHLLQWLEVSASTFIRFAALENPASSEAEEVFAFMAHAFDPMVNSLSPNGKEAAASAATPAATREPEAGSGV